MAGDWPTGLRPDPLDYAPDERPVGVVGPLIGGVALSLAAGLAWELLAIQTDWRLGFSPPVWEIVVAWLSFSAVSGFLLMVLALAATAFYATKVYARNPQSWDARQSVGRAKRKVAALLIGAGGVAAFGGIVTWIASRMGPEFEAYGGFARFIAFMGIVAVVGAVLYLKRALVPPP